jgi:hypothetical protein
MGNSNKLPRSAVLDFQIAAMEQSEQPLDEQSLEQAKGGIRYLPMYGVPIYKKPGSFPFPFPKIPFTKF